MRARGDHRPDEVSERRRSAVLVGLSGVAPLAGRGWFAVPLGHLVALCVVIMRRSRRPPAGLWPQPVAATTEVVLDEFGQDPGGGPRPQGVIRLRAAGAWLTRRGDEFVGPAGTPTDQDLP